MEHTTPARKAYPSDLRDAEWAILEPLVPAVKPGGRPARHARREIVNAILYVVRGGNQWRQPVARHAARPAAVANGLLLFSDLAQRGDVGADPHSVARAQPATAGTRGDSQRRDPRQS